MIFWACNKIRQNIIMNKIEITIRVNLIHLKLILKKNKKKLFTFTWIVRVKSLNCTGFSEKNYLSLVNSTSELKFTRNIQWSMAPLFTLFTEQWSHATLYSFLPHEKQPNVASPKPAVSSWILAGLTNVKYFFSSYQTILCVAVGEPHPQPR